MNNMVQLKQDFLYALDKPARYTGGERDSVVKDPDKTDIRFAMCFPDVYEIGMSHLGIQILYDMLNGYEDVWCERVYSPWVDADKAMREAGIPLFTLESRTPVKDMDFLGITLQYELCYTNILQILDLSGIPLMATDRTEDHPFVIGGGPCAYNPEPLADFFDLFYIGEGEVIYRQLLDVYKEWKASGDSREEFLYLASKVPGIYVPSLYQASYNEDGTIAAFDPLKDGVPRRVQRQVVRDMDHVPYPESPVIPYIKITQDRTVLEMMRGCIRGCRFCQAGMVYRPVRQKDPEGLIKTAENAIRNTGHEEINLSSLSTSDYERLPEFMDSLIGMCRDNHVNISLPSLRIDAFSLDVMKKVQDVKKSSLTFAPEAGSQRMRNVINKGLTEEVILDGAIKAFTGGWNKVKLYFMLGLPLEQDDDIRAIAHLAEKIAMAYYDTVPKEKRVGRCSIQVSTSFFVPKPFTPFQWAAQDLPEEFLRKAYLTKDTIRSMLNQKSIRYSYHEADASLLEAVLARGDRRVAPVIKRAYEKGCIFDAWSEHYHHDKWMESFEECGVDPAFYSSRVRSLDEILPWDFIDAGVTKAFLIREWERAQREEVTPNCRMECSGCGAAVYGCGVCVEKRGADEGGNGTEATDLTNIAEMQDPSDLNREALGPRDTARTKDSNIPDSEKPFKEVRISFSKSGEIRYTGHLDLMRYFQKAVRRSALPVAYTEGFSPHQIMSFAHPLGVGTESRMEYMDLRILGSEGDEQLRPEYIVNALNTVMDEGVTVTGVTILPDKPKSAMSAVREAEYEVYFRRGCVPGFYESLTGARKSGQNVSDEQEGSGGQVGQGRQVEQYPQGRQVEQDPQSGQDGLKSSLQEFFSQNTIPYEKKGKKGVRIIDLKEGLFELSPCRYEGNDELADDIYPAGIHMRVDASSAGNIKSDSVVRAYCLHNGEDTDLGSLRIVRTRLILEEC